MTEIYKGADNTVCQMCTDNDLVRSAIGITNSSIQNTIQQLFNKMNTISEELLIHFFCQNYQCLPNLVKPIIHEALLLVNSPQPNTTQHNTTQHNATRSKSIHKLRQKLKLQDAKSFFDIYHDLLILKILPNEIIKLKSLKFIPATKIAETRFIGSWVGPCLAAATAMVCYVVC